MALERMSKDFDPGVKEVFSALAERCLPLDEKFVTDFQNALLEYNFITGYNYMEYWRHKMYPIEDEL